MNRQERVRAGYPSRRTRVARSAHTPLPRIVAIRPALRAGHAEQSPNEALQRLLVLIPVSYNPDAHGVRKPVEAEKLVQTEREMREHFDGYSKSRKEGWFRDKGTGQGVDDELVCFEIDDVYDKPKLEFLQAWKPALETRFRQREIYMKFLGPVVPV